MYVEGDRWYTAAIVSLFGQVDSWPTGERDVARQTAGEDAHISKFLKQIIFHVSGVLFRNIAQIKLHTGYAWYESFRVIKWKTWVPIFYYIAVHD